MTTVTLTLRKEVGEEMGTLHNPFDCRLDRSGVRTRRMVLTGYSIFYKSGTELGQFNTTNSAGLPHPYTIRSLERGLFMDIPWLDTGAKIMNARNSTHMLFLPHTGDGHYVATGGLEMRVEGDFIPPSSLINVFVENPNPPGLLGTTSVPHLTVDCSLDVNLFFSFMN